MPLHLICTFWGVGGHRSPWRKPTQTWIERANHTDNSPAQESIFFPHQLQQKNIEQNNVIRGPALCIGWFHFVKHTRTHLHIRKIAWKRQSRHIIMPGPGQWAWERDLSTCSFIYYGPVYFYNKHVILW